MVFVMKAAWTAHGIDDDHHQHNNDDDDNNNDDGTTYHRHRNRQRQLPHAARLHKRRLSSTARGAWRQHRIRAPIALGRRT